MKGRVREEDTEFLGVHSPSCDGWNWVSLQPEARCFFWVSHKGAGAPSTWAIIYYLFWHMSRELDHKWSSQYSEKHPYVSVSPTGSDFTRYCSTDLNDTFNR